MLAIMLDALRHPYACIIDGSLLSWYCGKKVGYVAAAPPEFKSSIRFKLIFAIEISSKLDSSTTHAYSTVAINCMRIAKTTTVTKLVL